QNALHDFQPESDWRDTWNDTQVTNSHLVNDLNIKPSGHKLDRRKWTQLNRIRTNHGRCNYTLNKWNPVIDPMCDCDEPKQTIHHIHKNSSTYAATDIQSVIKKKFSGKASGAPPYIPANI
ncbi:hypothetical protein Bhyg_04048, partial [Pseudolycoriella hygida]